MRRRLIFLMCAGFVAISASTPVDVPTMERLRTLHFAEPAHVNLVPDNLATSHSFLRSSFDLFSAYRLGTSVLSNYQEPITTRGASGMAIYRNVSPAVVLVLVGSEHLEGLGSGALVDPRGYVLTNWHVISGHSNAVVFLKPPSRADVEKPYGYSASVVYASPTEDLALLKLDGVTRTLPSIPVASMSAVQVAEDVHIIGHPHGNLWSYSTGVVSQIRDDYSWKYDDGSEHHAKVLQLQTAINPGNSGGPVIDDSGQMLGLVAMSEEGQNLDYAIAADVIRSFMGIGMNFRTRGGSHTDSLKPKEVLFASSDIGDVWLFKFDDLKAYLVQRQSGPSFVAAEDQGGNTISSRISENRFSDWHFESSSGQQLDARLDPETNRLIAIHPSK